MSKSGKHLIYTNGVRCGCVFVTTEENRVTLGEVQVGTSRSSFSATGSSKRMPKDSRDQELGELLILEEALETLQAAVKEAVADRLSLTEVHQ